VLQCTLNCAANARTSTPVRYPPISASTLPGCRRHCTCFGVRLLPRAGDGVERATVCGERGATVGYMEEISYNFSITNNSFIDNAWGAGPTNPGFPTRAIYISESGGDSRVTSPLSGTAMISGNTFTDNWSGVVLWENADRFCSDGFDTPCTLINPRCSRSRHARRTCRVHSLARTPTTSTAADGTRRTCRLRTTPSR